MTSYDLILYAVAAVVCVVGFRNVTAVALALYCALVAIAGLGFGVAFSSQTSFMLDTGVMAVILAVKIPNAACTEPSNAARLVAAGRSLSLGDRVVLVCFPLMWTSYALPANQWWWALYILALAQLVAAGVDSVQNIIARSAKAGSEQPEDIGTLEFVSGREGFEWASFGAS